MADTELKLKIWRGDQIRAERLAAGLLLIEGFSSVDPQCPLGGPDGLKDVLCERNGWRYVAAAYFATEDKSFAAVKTKFEHDLPGVAANNVDGIVFMTNQKLTPGEREQLEQTASRIGARSIIYHLERIRSLLDAPAGYGLRLEYLDIDMAREEQLSFFAHWDRSFSDKLAEHGRLIVREISTKIDGLMRLSPPLVFETPAASLEALRTRSAGVGFNEQSDKTEIPEIEVPPSKLLTIPSLCLLHRALLDTAPEGVQVGELRRSEVWLGGRGRKDDARVVLPPPDEVPAKLQALLDWWVLDGPDSAAGPQEKILGITKFHQQFGFIHPFLDGNGRMGRLLLEQQARELFGVTRRVVLEDRETYLAALESADAGNFAALSRFIGQAILGSEPAL